MAWKDDRKGYHKEYRELHAEKLREKSREYYLQNKEIRDARNKEWRLNNPEHYEESQKNAMLKKQYGISLEEYDAMMQAQDGNCAICNRSQQEFKNSFDVDHDHTTGEVRGLLCPVCNKALGLMRDDTSLLKEAISYLEAHSHV